MSILASYTHHGLTLTVGEHAEGPGPARALRAPAPGASRFEIGEIDLGLSAAAVTVQARITGGNVGYVFAELFLKDPEADRFYGPVAREHAHASRDVESLGVVRPQWGPLVDLSVTLDLGLKVLTDGHASTFCFARPEGYSDRDRLVDGSYRPSGSSAPFRARVTLDPAGGVKRAVGYRGLGRRSLPRPFRPKPGDAFTPFVEVLTPAKPAQPVAWTVVKALTSPLVFGGVGPVIVAKPPLPGEYLAGVLVEDLDGRPTRKYVPFVIAG